MKPAKAMPTPAAIKPRKCLACPAMVYDLEHVRTRKAAVINVEPDPKGNILINLEEGTYTVLGGEAVKLLRQANNAPVYTSHFFTCPEAQRFRRR